MSIFVLKGKKIIIFVIENIDLSFFLHNKFPFRGFIQEVTVGLKKFKRMPLSFSRLILRKVYHIFELFFSIVFVTSFFSFTPLFFFILLSFLKGCGKVK